MMFSRIFVVAACFALLASACVQVLVGNLPTQWCGLGGLLSLALSNALLMVNLWVGSAWLFVLAIPASMLGTFAGGRVLDRMNDTDFKRWTAWIVTAIGLLYLVKAWQSV